MRLGKQLGALAAITTVPFGLAARAHADPDADFADQLHGYGIYGPRAHDAWLGKITCERLHNGLDRRAAFGRSARYQCTRAGTERNYDSPQPWDHL